MQKKPSLLMASLFLVSSFHTQAVLAKNDTDKRMCDLEQDRCSSKRLTDSQLLKSLALSDQLEFDLEALYQKNKALGKDTKVVLIGRMGQDMKKKFKVLKDRNGQESLQDLIKRLKYESRANQIDYSPAMDEVISYQTLLGNVDQNDELVYSHLGIAFRNLELKSPDDNSVITGGHTGKWAIVHLLYSCDKPQDFKTEDAYIKQTHSFRQATGAFFSDNLSGYKAQVIVPIQSVQDKLEDIILKKRQSYNFQTSQYNAAAKFDDLQQQNSNQFVLEALAAAMYPHRDITSRAGAIEVLKKTKYSPSRIAPIGLYSGLKIGFVQNLVSNIMPTVCLKTQPELKQHGIAEIVTSNSVLNWMKRNQILDEIIETKVDKEFLKDLDQAEPLAESPKSSHDFPQ